MALQASLRLFRFLVTWSQAKFSRRKMICLFKLLFQMVPKKKGVCGRHYEKKSPAQFPTAWRKKPSRQIQRELIDLTCPIEKRWGNRNHHPSRRRRFAIVASLSCSLNGASGQTSLPKHSLVSDQPLIPVLLRYRQRGTPD